MTRSALGSLAVVFLLTSAASAQYYPYGYGYGGLGRQGGAMYGASQMMEASGQVMVQQEQARIQRELANQAKIDTKRKAFDEMMYEKANTPTFTEEQEKIDSQILRRIMNKPTEAEVISGRSQNLILPHLRKMANTGVVGPPIPLDQDMLRSINVSSGSQGNLGILRDGGRLTWPPLLKGEHQKKIDAMLPPLVSQVIGGDLNRKQYAALTKEVQDTKEDWRKQLHKEEIDGPTFIDGKHFLDDLENAVSAMARTGAPKILDGSHAARGSNVLELVMNMTNNGLQFAPGNPGSEAAYYSLQNALVTYATAAQSGVGFQVQAPTRTPLPGPQSQR